MNKEVSMNTTHVDKALTALRATRNGGDRMTVLRVLQDGAYVVTNAKGDVSGDVYFDLFRFDDDRVAEHQAFSANGAPANKSGHTQTDGPTKPDPHQDTEKNKAIVQDYYETVHIGGNDEAISRYVRADTIRHEPGVRDGLAAFRADLAVVTRDRTIDRIRILLGQNDFVFIVGEGTHQGNPCVYVDLYRVQDGYIAERWGFAQ
jgi:predicted SnoaL-like aldol condensation-catalyzing enzyme